MRRLKGELDTIVFLAGAVLIVVGVAMYSVPAAFILAGFLLCAAAVGVSYFRTARKAKR